MCILKKIKVFNFSLILTAILSACSANHYSIHQKDQLNSDSSTVIAVDAKQRFLLSNIATKTTETVLGNQVIPRTTEIYRRYCLEPSPDVFSVLSQTMSGSGSFGQTADPKSINVALQAAFSSSETGATISRTQTVNMLKEMMYRTCESYLNGQIDELEYPTIAARDQRIMTSILAIEQLTGTLQQKPVIIAATANASSDAINILENAKKDVDEKKTALTTAQKEFAEIDKPEGTCKTLLDKKADEIKTDEDKVKLKGCNDKKNNVSKAETELKSSKAHYDAILSLSGKPGVSSTTTGAQSLYSSSSTEIDKQIEQARSQATQAVAKTVENIVGMSFDQGDETSFFCYRALKDEKTNCEVAKACLDYIATKVKSETLRLKTEMQETRKTVEADKKLSFDKFWEKIKKDSHVADSEKIKQIIDKAFPLNSTPPLLGQKLKEMKQETNKDKLFTIFMKLDIPPIERLIKDQCSY